MNYFLIQMKKTSLILIMMAMFVVANPVLAEESKVLTSPVPSGIRMRLQEIKENKEKKKQLKEEIKEGREVMRKENKAEREAFREEWKNMTPEERLSIMPTRKAMIKENIKQRKSFFDETKSRWKELGLNIRTGWKDLLNKWSGSK